MIETTAPPIPRVRYKVVALAVSLAAITYLDRVCIGVLAPRIQDDLGLSLEQMSVVFSAFTLSYAIFEMPTAAWADRIGSRHVVARIVLWWSAFTMATAAAFGYWSMVAIRFLFGVGEAGAWPNAARVFSRWVPVQERGKVQGVFFAGAHLMGGLTPALVALIAVYLPWRAVFIMFGFVGLGWTALWYHWFRDEPREHKSVSAAERDYIEANRGMTAQHSRAPWHVALSIPSVIPLCLQYVANTYGFYFFITWLPTYLERARGMQTAELAIFAGLPLTFSTVADIAGGTATDALARRFGIRRGYQMVGSVSYLLAAVLMAIGAFVEAPQLAGILIAVAGACSMAILPPSWNTAVALGGPNAGLVSAAMNTAGQVGGFFSPIVLAFLVGRYNDWRLPLYVLAALYFVSSLLWFFIDPVRKLDPLPSKAQ